MYSSIDLAVFREILWERRLIVRVQAVQTLRNRGSVLRSGEFQSSYREPQSYRDFFFTFTACCRFDVAIRQ